MRIAGASGSAAPPSGWIATTICVSGYAPVSAWRVESSELQVAISGTVDDIKIVGIFVTQRREEEPPKVDRHMCGACNSHVPEHLCVDERLGFRSYCTPCVERLAVRCKRLHARLPSNGSEFFCMGCEEIRQLAQLVKPDSNGRRRWRCRPCRQRQWRMRNK